MAGIGRTPGAMGPFLEPYPVPRGLSAVTDIATFTPLLSLRPHAHRFIAHRSRSHLLHVERRSERTFVTRGLRDGGVV